MKSSAVSFSSVVLLEEEGAGASTSAKTIKVLVYRFSVLLFSLLIYGIK